MPSTAIQSRIAAFEAQAHHPNARPPSPQKPSLAHKTSLIDLHDWVLDDMPPVPQVQLDSPPKPKPKPKPKPPALQVKSENGTKKRPPLPPRRSTQDSDTSLLYPPLGGVEAVNGENGRKGNHVPASSVSSFHSVSLSSDTDPDTPNSVANMIATYPIDKAPPSPSSLTESFEEISIPPPLPQRPLNHSNSSSNNSSIPSPPPRSAQSQTTPTQTPLPYVPRRVPPPPPSRASDRSSIQSSASSSQSRRSSSSVQTPTLVTTLPLPPPSTPSPVTIAKTKRPTPVPSAARKRYHAVFNANIIQRRRAEVVAAKKPQRLSHTEAKRTRQAAGWRGLSVDLITASPEELLNDDERGKEKEKEIQVDETVGPDDRLEASIVKAIWSRSRIEKSKLAEIWNECDPEGTGSLDLEGFIRGMWRIDEHLRRTQTQTLALRNASSTSLTSLRSGLGSLRIKSGHPGLQRSTSRSSLGTSLSRSSSVSSRPPTSAAYEYPPPPVPKIVLR